MHNFRELKVWQRGIELAVDTYQMTSRFPADEKFGMISQIKRCAVSIPSNIAEGCGRNTKKDFAHYLDITVGSANELETQLIIANRLDYIDDQICNSTIAEINEIQKMTRTLISKFR